MKILLADIETAPHKVYSWGLWQQNIAINQIEEAGYTLCWAAKWLGDKDIMFSSIYSDTKLFMLQKIHALLDEADVVVHYNGTRFDIPTLNQEFLVNGLGPPSPVIEIDLLKTARQRFRLPSNKLDYVARHLGVEGKLSHKGMSLWQGCMAGDKASWATMEAYNKQDIVVLEKVYHHFLPWIANHPNHALFDSPDGMVCPNCGSGKLQKRGLSYTKTMTYQRYQCQDCGTWSRERTTNLLAEQKKNVLVGVK